MLSISRRLASSVPATAPVSRPYWAVRRRAVLVPAVVLGLVVCGALFSTLVGAACPPPEALTLRVEDGEARPGALLAVVVRTYSPRGVASGQICFRQAALRSPAADEGTAPESWIEGIESALVFTEADDAQVAADWDGTTGELLLDFSSASAGVNDRDGPMAVLFLRLADDAPVGGSFAFELDLEQTFLVDGAGQAIELEPRGGTMEVLAPSAPFELGAEGGEITPGDWAELGFGSRESRAFDEGRLDLELDPAWAAADWRERLEVRIDRRFGTAEWSWQTSAEGRVSVTFASPDHTLGRVPGTFVEVRVPVALGVAPGTISPISIGAETRLEGADGQNLDLETEGDQVEIVAPMPFFADGFESGTVDGWCTP